MCPGYSACTFLLAYFVMQGQNQQQSAAGLSANALYTRCLGFLSLQQIHEAETQEIESSNESIQHMTDTGNGFQCLSKQTILFCSRLTERQPEGDWRWMKDSSDSPSISALLLMHTAHTQANTHTEKCMQTHTGINKRTCYMSALCGVIQS